MDKKTKIFFIVFFAVVFVIISICVYKFFVLKDYYITSKLSCDPASESCFIETCDPADDDTCPTAPTERVSFYKLIKKKAYNMPLCDPNNINCQVLSCDNDVDCQMILCDQNTEDCSNPESNLSTEVSPSSNLSN